MHVCHLIRIFVQYVLMLNKKWSLPFAIDSCWPPPPVPVLSVYFFLIRSQKLRHCFNKCHHMSPLVWKSTPSDNTIKVDDKAHLLVLVLVLVVVVVVVVVVVLLLLVVVVVVVVVPFPGRDWKCCAFPVPFPGCDWKCCVFPVPFPGCDWKCRVFPVPFPGRDWKCRVFPVPFPGCDRKCCVFPIPFLQRVRSAVFFQFPFSFPVPFQFPSSSLPSSLRGFPMFFQGKCVADFFLLKKKTFLFFI